MSEIIEPPAGAPMPASVPDLLGRGRSAAEAGDWIAAAHAWVQAAMRGSLEGAERATRAAVELRLSADAGSAEAAALLAGILLEYFDESALPLAVTYAEASAEAGNPAGQRTYGYLLVEGIGVEPDPVAAAGLFRPAAESGDDYGTFNLAQHTDDADESLRLLARAAGQGLVEAGAVLGDRLSSMDRDAEALNWYLWAAHERTPGQCTRRAAGTATGSAPRPIRFRRCAGTSPCSTTVTATGFMKLSSWRRAPHYRRTGYARQAGSPASRPPRSP
ncbi:tetratricopeptide repeat protein [Saccharomonospora xinjiangensis]|nr:sel1 repeat family protein [Saccharomonospora xinjiangensis]